MATTAYDTYLESRIMSADPVELVALLYHAALDAVRQARKELRQGRIRERSRAITRASDVLNELALSVDHEAGGELSRNLVELYAYLQQLLIDANTRQQDGPLEHAEKILVSMVDAWQSCRENPSAAAGAEAGAPADYTPLSCTC